MDRRGRPDRVRRYLILVAVGISAVWGSFVPEDAPLYSKSTDLPIYSKTTGLPIQGNPDTCGCCGSACALCGSDRTPDAVQLVLSGLMPCPDCLTQLWHGPGQFRVTSVPNGLFELARDPVDPCRYTATTTYTCDTWSAWGDCSGQPDGSATPPVRIELVRQDTLTWKLKIRGERPGGPAPEVWLFDGTVQAACDVGWVINNIWPADACGEGIPQETHIAYGGSATGQPL